MNANVVEASLTEAGNGFPSKGDKVYHPPTDSVYSIAWIGRIHTSGQGNWVPVKLESTGECAHDLDEDEWGSLSDCIVELDAAEGTL